MMTAILRVTLEWRAIAKRRFGVGDISLAGGAPTPDHKSHKSGLEADIRPLRKEGIEAAVRWWESEYDKEGTERLLELFRTFAPVVFVYFNGADIRS